MCISSPLKYRLIASTFTDVIVIARIKRFGCYKTNRQIVRKKNTKRLGISWLENDGCHRGTKRKLARDTGKMRSRIRAKRLAFPCADRYTATRRLFPICFRRSELSLIVKAASRSNSPRGHLVRSRFNGCYRQSCVEKSVSQERKRSRGYIDHFHAGKHRLRIYRNLVSVYKAVPLL